MYRQIPNLITISRLFLTAAFFALLNVHQSATFARTMWWAFAIFVVASVTDMLDGYLARTWHVESAFGRVVDPFVDKILICGAFVFFASTEFISHEELAQFNKNIAITGVAPWMAVVLIAREFLITGLRGLAESRGIDFRADWAGKIKMVVQSATVGAITADVASAYGGRPVEWIRVTRDILIWTTLAITIFSATSYIIRARRVIDH